MASWRHHRARSSERPWQQRSRAGRRARKWAAIGVLGGVAVAALFWSWRIRDVEVTGATIIPNAAVRDAVLTELQGSRWGVFPATSVLLARTGRLEQVIRDRFAFATVSARRHVDGRLSVSVTEQPLAALVRFEEGTAMLLAASGQLVAPFPESLNGAAGLLDIQLLGASRPVGESIMPAEVLALLRGLWVMLEQSGGALQPQFIGGRAGQGASFDIHTQSGAVMTAAAGSGAERQLAKLRVVLQNYATPEARAKIRTIDLRYGDRVYIQ